MSNWFSKDPRENRRRRRDPYSLDVKVRSSHRAQAQIGRAILWLAAALAVGLVVVCSYRAFTYFVARSFTDNPAYNIASIHVQTDGVIERADILKLSGVSEGQNLFTVDLAAVRAALESHPSIRRAEIRRVLPGKLQIVVSERVPVAQIYTLATRDNLGRVIAPPTGYLIDATAVVMRPAGALGQATPDGKPGARLPLLTGVDMRLVKEGSRIASEQVQKGLDLIHLCEASDLGPLLDYDRVDVATEGFLVMVTRQGGLVTFAASDMAHQLRRLKVILTHPARAGQIVRTCDLSVGLNVPVTYFSRSGAADAMGAAAVAMSNGAQIIHVRRGEQGGRFP